MARPKSNVVELPKAKEPCGRCGQVHERCSGHADIYDNGDYKTGTKIGERPCRHWPMHGQRVCQTHGGAGRNRKRAAAQWKKDQVKSKAMEQLTKAVQTLGLPIEVNPQQALLDEIYRTAGHVNWLAAQVAALEPGDLSWGTISEERKEGTGEMAGHDSPDIDLTTTVKGARPAVLYEMYRAERAHLVHVAKVAIQCGIAERQIKLAEDQGRMIADAWRNVIEAPELELTDIQITVARTLVSKALRTMSLSRPAVPVLANGNGNGHHEE